jgi:hypothetical protein
VSRPKPPKVQEPVDRGDKFVKDMKVLKNPIE